MRSARLCARPSHARSADAHCSASRAAQQTGLTGSLVWVGWASYAAAVRANREQPAFALSDADKARQQQHTGVDPAAAARATEMVRGRATKPLAERLAELPRADTGTLQARLASLRLAPRSAEFDAEKTEVRRILAQRGAPENPRR